MGADSTIPFTDDFESYTNLAPLVNGTNGWYGSSGDIIVQTNTVRSGTNSAAIPIDCTLSNVFESRPSSNVWIQMDVRQVLYDNTNNPIVDTNVAAMFFVNSNGNYVVHNGLATNAAGTVDVTNSANWVIVASAPAISLNPVWVRVNIMQDFSVTNWSLYSDGVLVTNNIGFINPALTNLTILNIYNGAATTFLDNVSVTVPDTNHYPLVVVPSALTQSNLYANATVAVTPNVQTIRVVNVWSTDIGFQVRTSQYWVAASPTNGNVAQGTTQEVVLTYASIQGWTAGTSNAIVTVVATNGSDYWSTQTVQVALNLINISDSLYVTPTQFVNSVWRGATPTNRPFKVQNLGDLPFTYTVTTNIFWIASLSNNVATLGAYGTNTLTLTNTVNTLGWALGTTSNAVVTVTATNTASGVFAVQTVAVAVSVDEISNVFSVTPTDFSHAVWIGDTPTQRTFKIINSSDASFTYLVTTGSEGFVTSLPVAGTVAANATNTVTNTYRPTWNWTTGTSNTTVKVASSNGYGTTQMLAVAVTVQPAALNYYVATNGGDVFPYTNWDGAALKMTSAVFKANIYTNVSSIVWVSNGVHTLPAEIIVSNVTVRSLNGATNTIVNGGSFRGFSLVHPGSVLNGLTITNCRAGRGTNGGGVIVTTGLVWNCILMKNSATNGGGVAVGSRGVVRDCLIWGNTATNGGGVYFVTGMTGIVENCTIASNYAVKDGGGLYTSNNTTGLCMNAVVYQNTAGGAGAYTNWGTNVNALIVFTNSCVAPDGIAGGNNITANPLFINVANGDCRLANRSPCINTGTNQAWMVNELDLAGNMRIRMERVDMGAYEWYFYQGRAGIRVNGVLYDNIRFINGTPLVQVNGVP